MTSAFRRATLRLSPVVRAGTAQACRRQQPFLTRFEPTIIPSLRRSYASSSTPQEDDATEKAKELSQKAVEREERQVTSGTSAQSRENDRPWQRASSSAQPESTSPDPARGDKTKGRLLTTPTRLLKLILPMPFHPEQEHINEPVEGQNKNDVVEPLALLVHPQQPLSYLERLIQAELPTLKHNGREKLPDIVFRAEADHEESRSSKEKKKKDNNNSANNHANVASYSGLGHEGPSRKDANWVRWSGSTEVGDFIRDAARGREFALDVEGYGEEIRVAVPSFRDRTHYMRTQLRKMSRELNGMVKIKNECDKIAHKGAHRLAQGGFAALGIWWGIVYYVTFHTEMGWDLVEPVTYLAGLTTIMGGYLWFLFISRDLSYKSAMNITVSRRQNASYQLRGFDHHRWEQLVHEANALRQEIKIVAAEYDADWDETKDLGGEEVKEVLEKEKQNEKEDKDKVKEDTKKESRTSDSDK